MIPANAVIKFCGGVHLMKAIPFRAISMNSAKRTLFACLLVSATLAITPAALGQGQRGGGQRGQGQRGQGGQAGAPAAAQPAQRPQPLATDLFTSKNFYKDKALWLDQRYFRCNSPRELTDM